MTMSEQQQLQQKYQAVVDWVLKNGGYISDLIEFQVIPGTTNRQLVAKKVIPPGVELINIPEKCRLSGETMYETCLKFTFEVAKGADSFYHSFIENFPTAYQLQDLPVYKYTPNDKFESTEFKERMAIYFGEVQTFLTKYLLQNASVP